MVQKLIAFGDSITLGHWDEDGGWIAHVRRRADERVLKSERNYYATVYNLGISSNTSRHVLGRYRSEVDARHTPGDADLFVVFAVGINDSAIKTDTMEHLVPPDVYDANMRALITLAKQDAGHRVLVIGLTPVYEPRTTPANYRLEREYRLAEIEVYNEIARRTAQNTNVRFANLLAELKPHGNHWHAWDGVHLKAEAHRRIAQLIEYELVAMGWGHVTMAAPTQA